MVLATLVGAEEVCAAGRSRPTNGYVFGDGRSSCNKRPAVGTTWFPVSDDVMKNGRLADGYGYGWWETGGGFGDRGGGFVTSKLRSHAVCIILLRSRSL